MPFAAAVRDLEQQHAVAPGGIHRLQDEEIGCEVDLAVRPCGRMFEVDDRLVVPVGRIERELDRSHQLLVGPVVPNGWPSATGRPRGDVTFVTSANAEPGTNEQEREQNPEHEPGT